MTQNLPFAVASYALHLLFASAFALAVAGCTSLTEQIAVTMQPMERSWAGITRPGRKDSHRQWAWMSAVPSGAARAGVLQPVVDYAAVARFMPDFADPGIRLISEESNSASVSIANVEGVEIRSVNDLYAVLSGLGQDQRIQVDFADAHREQAPRQAVQTDRASLQGIAQMMHPEQQIQRVTEGGQTWVEMRAGSERVRIGARVERSIGLLHLIVSVQQCWGDPKTLPLDVTAACNGKPLRCLSASETLESLYGQPTPVETEVGQTAHFAFVSTRDDYLLLDNYQRLQRAAADPDAAHPRVLRPALLQMESQAYPGPPLLADARALGGFLLEPIITRAGDPERTGWVMFAGEQLKSAEEVSIQVQLSAGTSDVVFILPKG